MSALDEISPCNFGWKSVVKMLAVLLSSRGDLYTLPKIMYVYRLMIQFPE